jgi:TRAP-type mannitol/chloroaromatic compound transport system substrate-binding protein
MKRRDFIKVTGLGVAGAATIAAPAIAQSIPEIKWRMTTSWPKSLEGIGPLEHDPEKWVPVFRKDHAQTKG